ncbi:PREDICTED: transmembrane protein 31 [Galeopterus variegatus]|uniref:Transmembrane protein 31 n=1 Tax=Galeopterus variegatus TaxID=482537 RepID=A0ABM0RMN7_GALVR|nr:PREDICTED: transmembrane protein 31 [Galeopterus variegatus]
MAMALGDSKRDMINGTGDHSTVEEMGLTNKSEGVQQLKPSNSDAPNEDQGEETQRPEEASTAFLIPT